ncbi:MAG: putative toxin-antitoxin system toxin component, PIN family [Clostridium sp.]|nr:putative toxin-antitoxin system toxin component, PIN family [Acetatifactor muris]MCM1527151.1 putative toxin-antitoxin system toxin component, PIN family [Bacteroides sp.]MCM1563466.1 putative toxin-antitoxin system toxin component, PIN family [Clostridium sp.]
MKILADTNILISAVLFPHSKPAKALIYTTENHDLVLCDQNLTEFREVLNRKAPRTLPDAEALLTELSFELIPATPYIQKKIRDANDQPILNAAILYNIDIILTGDKDFLSLDSEHPKCMTAAQFLDSEGVKI